MAEIFMTGATGFVGRHLLSRLQMENHHIRCLTRRKPIAAADVGGISWICGELNEPGRWASELNGVDYVIHLAGLISSRSAREYQRVNVDGTRHLLEACRNHGGRIRRFLHVSSIAAHGPHTEAQLIMEDDPAQPESAYGMSKLQAEHLVTDHAACFPVVILRPSFVYGPGDERGLHSLRLLSRQGDLISFRIIETASLCYVDDLVTGCVTALNGPVESGEIFNICDSHVYTWREIDETLARVVREVYPEAPGENFLFKRTNAASGRTTPVAGRTAAGRRYWGCSIDKARAILGFTPRYTLLSGARETVRWYRERKLYAGQ